MFQCHQAVSVHSHGGKPDHSELGLCLQPSPHLIHHHMLQAPPTLWLLAAERCLLHSPWPGATALQICQEASSYLTAIPHTLSSLRTPAQPGISAAPHCMEPKGHYLLPTSFWETTHHGDTAYEASGLLLRAASDTKCVPQQPTAKSTGAGCPLHSLSLDTMASCLQSLYPSYKVPLPLLQACFEASVQA